MFRKILLTLDGSELSDKVIQHALGYAKAARADIVAISIASEPCNAMEIPKDPQSNVALAENNAVETGPITETVAEAARRMGVHCDAVNTVFSSSVDAITDVYKRYCCDVIYISARQGPGRITRDGSGQNLAYEILEKSAMPVLVFR
ncbi:MAG: universal stress protein [Burkholderiaceae bacterium]